MLVRTISGVVLFIILYGYYKKIDTIKKAISNKNTVTIIGVIAALLILDIVFTIAVIFWN